MRKLWIKSLVDRLSGQVVEESEYTNARVASASTTTASGTTTIGSITVPPTSRCVIYSAFLYSGAAGQIQLTYTQTGDTQTVYYDFASAGAISDVKSVKEPVLSMQNLTTGDVSINISVQSATSGTKYSGNVWYILR